MNCSEFNNYLDRTLHGELSPDERIEMARHAGICRDCARLLAAQQMIAATFDTTEPLNAPQGLADRIRARIDAEESGVVLPFTNPISAVSTITCEAFESNVVAFADGLLSADQTHTMTEHRASCKACEKLARAHETVTAAFADTEPVAAPAGLADRIRAAALQTETAAEPVIGNISPRKYGILIAAVAFISILTAGFLHIKLRTPATITPGPITQTIDSFILHITMLPALFEAWVARTIPAEQWITIARLLEPVELPYMPFEFSRLFYIFATIVMVSSWGLVWRTVNNPMAMRQRF